MEIHYKRNKIKKQLSNASQIKKAFGENAKKISARLADIEASPNLEVLTQIPAANCHALTGNRNGEWAINISENHRMIFEIADDPIPTKEDGSVNKILIKEIKILNVGEDYH